VSRVALWLTLFALLALAGCGGSSGESTSSQGIPGSVAEALADRADAIADTYDGGDVCGAAQQADDLLGAVTRAVEGGRIPAELQGSLIETAQKLQDDINCPPPTTTGAQDCGQLEEQRKALEEERKDTKGEGKKRKLDEQIKQLDEQIKACKDAGGEETD
jgi:hypothetical protein